MRHLITAGAALAALVGTSVLAAPARADDDEAPTRGAGAGADGYCDYVEGTAAARSALQLMPELFGSVGYLDQSAIVDVPEATSNSLRVTAGLRYKLSGIYEGLQTRKRASADCRRHTALVQVQGETTYRALAARSKVLEAALPEAERILKETNRELRAGRATTQDATATRLRVDELRSLAAEAHHELGALPVPADDRPLVRALASYYEADADVERHEGQLRRAQAIDVSVRVGYDKFLENDDVGSPYFAVLSVGLNLGWFLQGSANERAASGRRRYVQEDRGAQQVDSTIERLRDVLVAERTRLEQTSVLLADLEKQLDDLKRVAGESGRRYRQSLWFDWVKLKAEHEYLAVHVANMRAALDQQE